MSMKRSTRRWVLPISASACATLRRVTTKNLTAASPCRRVGGIGIPPSNCSHRLDGGMMDKVSLYINQKNCMGCHACEAACKQEHGLHVGPQLIHVVEKAPKFIPIYCHQCGNAPCKAACPVDAIVYNELGIVQVIPANCIGCRGWVGACPFGA